MVNLSKKQDKLTLGVSKKTLFMLGVVLLFMVLLIPQFGDLKASFETIKNADVFWLTIGFITSMSTFLGGALTYVNISLHHLSYYRTLQIQISNGFANKLLPAGAGGMTVNGRYLYKAGHNAAQAASVVGLNNTLGFVGYLIALVIAMLVTNAPLTKSFSLDAPSRTIFLVSLIILVAIIGLLCVTKVRNRIIEIAKEVIYTLKNALKRPWNLLWATFGQTSLPMLFTTTLFLSALALGTELSMIQAFYVFTIGQAAASVTPTPGGVGGAEAGLTAALISIGLSSTDAIAIALTYRFLTYWLPMLPGVFMFRYIAKKKFI